MIGFQDRQTVKHMLPLSRGTMAAIILRHQRHHITRSRCFSEGESRVYGPSDFV